MADITKDEKKNILEFRKGMEKSIENKHFMGVAVNLNEIIKLCRHNRWEDAAAQFAHAFEFARDNFNNMAAEEFGGRIGALISHASTIIPGWTNHKLS